MKYFSIIILETLQLIDLNAQSNHLFALGKLVNFNTVDISLYSKTTWRAVQSNNSGYFIFYGNANYIEFANTTNIDGYGKTEVDKITIKMAEGILSIPFSEKENNVLLITNPFNNSKNIPINI